MSEFNFNSQVCTDRNQSERLLALGLKKETADMSWIISYHCECFVGNPEELYTPDEDGCDDIYIPAWSLHRLIEMIQDAIVNKDGTDDNLMLDISGIGLYDGTIDAIAELIKEGYFPKEYLV